MANNGHKLFLAYRHVLSELTHWALSSLFSICLFPFLLKGFKPITSIHQKRKVLNELEISLAASMGIVNQYWIMHFFFSYTKVMPDTKWITVSGNPTKIISTSWSGAHSKEDSSCFETIRGSLRLMNDWYSIIFHLFYIFKWKHWFFMNF